jgi:signal transduction histidine kinase
MPANLPAHIVVDIQTLQEIPSLPELLKSLSDKTGMGTVFIIAKAELNKTEENWICCIAHDGLKMGVGIGFQFHNTLVEDTSYFQSFTRNNDIERESFPINVKSFMSVPIVRANGSLFGMLCAMDTRTAIKNVKKSEDECFFYSKLLSGYIEMVEKLEHITNQLREEKEIAERQSTYSAILGHDLRNPVGTARICSDIILKASIDPVIKKNAQIIKSSSYRMQGLIDSMLDTAQGRYGDGIRLEKTTDNVRLISSLYHVVDEIKAIHGVEIITSVKLSAPINCDVGRISQLLSNLLTNAVHHGDGNIIWLDIKSVDKFFNLTVTNTGDTIPKSSLKKIFQPYFSNFNSKNKSGVGLGLYISSQIANGHGGILNVTSAKGRTEFILSIPNN